MKIPSLYNLGVALTVIQSSVGWWTVARMPGGSPADDSDSLLMTYRSFLEYSSLGAVYSACVWALLIFLARSKRVQPSHKHAGFHFQVISVSMVYRIFLVVVFGAVKTPTPEFTAMATHCIREVAFASATCAPFGVTLMFPVVEILLAGVVAFLIRKRAIARHGTARVEPPPPPPKLVAAWTLGEIMELDDIPAEGGCKI